jgi:hypothetical protein
VPFLKVSRDKRGYEHYYLVESFTGRRGRVRQRILYWFRSPPNLKIGRQPFDESVARELQAQYPGTAFDWVKLREAPPPPPPAEYWRERRRLERTARQLRDTDEPESEPAAGEPVLETAELGQPRDTVTPSRTGEEPRPATGPGGAVAPIESTAGPARRRRRRRRGARVRGPVEATLHGGDGRTAVRIDASTDASANSFEAPHGTSDEE